MTQLAQAPLGTASLPAVVDSLVARAGGPSSALQLRLTYLRRKPGRGLVAMYRVEQPRSVAPLVHLLVEERALEGASVAVSRDRLERPGSLAGRWPGPISDAELGITLQAFPADAELPALAAACQPTRGTAVFVALDDARRALGASGSLVTATAAPIRYKPGDRCVIRYALALSDGTTLGVVGKLYASAAQAGELHRQTQRVYDEQLTEGERPLLPRPLELVGALGLVLTEDLATAGPVVAGTSILRPAKDATQPPVTAIENAAAALARLHTGAVLPESIRSAATEASRARKRALRVADFVPELGERAARLADRVQERLELSSATPSVPAHGSFKPAQLVFRGGRVLITDFDQFCTADPALDVGYFLAYLRPHSLWYGRRAARAWFEAAATAFLSAYGRAAVAHGESARAVEATAVRSRAYQAAVLFKIANRPFNRLQSPRLRELAAIQDEIESCVDGEA